jgi:hypothetical protein
MALRVSFLPVLFLFLPGFGAAWEYRTEATNGADANAVLMDGVGDVISAGVFQNSSDDWVVIEHSSQSGLALWQRIINSRPSGTGGGISLAQAPQGGITAATYDRYGHPGIVGSVVTLSPVDGSVQSRIDYAGVSFYAVATDSIGDIVAAGSILNSDASDQDLLVVKLDSATGAELWRCVISGAVIQVGEYGDAARAVAIDPNGQVFVGGVLSNDSVSPTDYFVAKLDGATGAELWAKALRGTGGHGSFVNSLAVDQVGDVVAGGGMHILPDWIHMVVAKFASADGSELWLQDYDPYPGSVHVTYSVAIDPAGDIMTADWLASSISSVIKLSGITGALVWRYDFPDIGIPTGSHGGSRAVGVDAAGNAVAIAAPLANGASYPVIAAAKLSGATGRELWRNIVDSDRCGDSAAALAVGASGDVAVAGSVFLRQGGVCALQGLDYAVFKWIGSSGARFGPACGSGIEPALILPPLMWLRERRRRKAA